MDATCAIQASIHVFSLVRKYVSRILGTYQTLPGFFHYTNITMFTVTRVRVKKRKALDVSAFRF